MAKPEITSKFDTRAEAVRDKLERAGYASYHVGGCVRDILMGVNPHDWDIATQALPEQIAAVFANDLVIPTGVKYGTVTVLIDELPIQVTTMRSDGDYSDHRHVDTVSFETNINTDLARRDLTINAMAYSPATGIIDPYDGSADIKRRQLRSVGDPVARFAEDGLRIMRVLRFASVLGFTLDPDLADALHKKREVLQFVASERLMSELNKLLVGSNAQAVLLEFPDVLSVFIPEIAPTVGFEQHSSYHDLDVWGHTAKAVACAPQDAIVRLTLLMHDLAKPSCFTFKEPGIGTTKGHDHEGALIAKRRLEALHVDRATAELVSKLIKWHGTKIQEAKPKRWLNRLGEQDLRRFVEVKRADIAAHSELNRDDRLQRLDKFMLDLEQAIEEEACFSLDQLAISGADVLEAGVPQGPLVGKLLNLLLESVLDGAIANTRADLTAHLLAQLKLLKCSDGSDY